MTKMGRDIISALIIIFWGILVLLVLSVVCRADELQYRIDYETCLYDMLHADESNEDWDTTKVWRLINEGVTFVEGVSKANEIQDTISFAPGTSPVDTSIFYALSTGAASGGVLNVLYVDKQQNELIALSKRPPEEFGKDHLGQQKAGAKRTYMFCEFGDTIAVYPRPDINYVMHIWSYKVSDWLESDSSEVGLPLFHRLLALEMAYAYAQLSTGTQVGFERYQNIRQNVLTALYGIPSATPKDTQSLGIITGEQ